MSTAHLAMKIPTPKGNIFSFWGDQYGARHFYMTSLRQDVGPVMVVEVPIEAVSDHIPEVRGKPHEDVKTVELIEGPLPFVNEKGWRKPY